MKQSQGRNQNYDNNDDEEDKSQKKQNKKAQQNYDDEDENQYQQQNKYNQDDDDYQQNQQDEDNYGRGDDNDNREQLQNFNPDDDEYNRSASQFGGGGKKQQMSQLERINLLLFQKFNLYDFIFPAGKLAKLCRINDLQQSDFDIQDILKKFKLNDGLPTCIFVGAQEANRGKFFAGIARACFRTDAVIIDSAIKTGIEQFVIRRNVKLIGVAPENQIKFPKINPTTVERNELANGHNYLFLLKNKSNTPLQWGDEAIFKFDLANNIAQGDSIFKAKRKQVVILLGDHQESNLLLELKLAIENQLPIIVVPGSDVCNEIINALTQENYKVQDQELDKLIDIAHFYVLDNNSSEEIASYIHFLLTTTPFPVEKKFRKLIDRKKILKL